MKNLALMLLFFTLVGATPAPVVVDYAGSLVTPMEGPIATALAGEGITFQGEGKGSKALAHLISSGLRSPDVFISADKSLVDDLQTAGLVERSTTFASVSLVLGYNAQSRFIDRFRDAAAGKIPARELLSTPGLRVARTDPALDPKGSYTLESLKALDLPNDTGSIYPEEDLLVRLETGVVDCAFLYTTEAIARHLPVVTLPANASLSGRITYTLAVMKRAPHPVEASRFEEFILHGDGRRILETAGLTYRK